MCIILKFIKRPSTATSLEPSILFVVSEDTLLSLCLSTPIQPIQNFSEIYGDLDYKPAIQNAELSLEHMPVHLPTIPDPFVCFLLPAP